MPSYSVNELLLRDVNWVKLEDWAGTEAALRIIVLSMNSHFLILGTSSIQVHCLSSVIRSKVPLFMDQFLVILRSSVPAVPGK